MKKVILAVVVMGMLSGCNLAKFNNWFNTNEDSIRTAIHLITDIALKGNPVKAGKVTLAVNKVLSQIPDGTLVPADMLSSYITNRLAGTDLDAADKIVLGDMTAPIQAKIMDTLTVLNLKDVPSQAVDVKMILKYVTDISAVIK